MHHPAMKHFEMIDGHVVNTLSIEQVQPILCGFPGEDSDAEEGDVIGANIITHSAEFSTREHTPEDIHEQYLS